LIAITASAVSSYFFGLTPSGKGASLFSNWATQQKIKVGAELMFQVISERAERATLVLTTNLPFSELTQVFHSNLSIRSIY